MSRFTPSINDKNVVCLVKKGNGSSCNHLMKWTQSKDGKRRTVTSGLTSHIEKKHLDKYKEIMKEVGTSEERKAPVEADITRMDRHQRGVQPPGRRLPGHDTDARGRGHPR